MQQSSTLPASKVFAQVRGEVRKLVESEGNAMLDSARAEALFVFTVVDVAEGALKDAIEQAEQVKKLTEDAQKASALQHSLPSTTTDQYR